MSKEVEYLPITELLTEIIDNRGKSVPTVDEGFPLIATNCIKHSSIYPTFEKVRYVSESTLKTWFRAHIKPNDILFVNKGTPGRVCLVPDPVTFCAAQDMIAFRSNPEKINYKYLFAVLRSKEIQKKIENNHVGLVIPHFRKQELSSLLIPIKSKKDQEAIGNLYLTLSEKIELNNRINAELEAMAKTLYDYWFVQFDFPASAAYAASAGKPELAGKPYKSSGGKMVWNEELKREIPEGWEVQDLADVTELISRGISPKYLDSDGICVLNQKCIRENKVLFEFSRRHDNESKSTISRKVNLYDMLVNSTGVGTLGRVAIVKRLPENIITVDSHVTIVRVNAKKINPLYFGFSLIQKQKEIEGFSVGSTGQVELSRSQLESIKLVVPKGDQQSSFGEMYERMLSRMAICETENQKLAELRDWLLPMLMNGQVKVKEEMGTELAMAAEPKGKYKKG